MGISDKNPDQNRLDRVLRAAVRAAGFGVWRVTLDPLTLYWSDETAAIHGEPPGTSPPLDRAFDYYAPEHREPIRAAFNRCASEGVPFDEKMQLITARDDRVWVRAVGEPERDDSGKIVAVVGGFQDISELMQARGRAEAVSAELQRAMENMSDAFFTLDQQWCFSFMNSQAELLLNRSREDLLGKCIWDEFPDAVGSQFQRQYQHAMGAGNTVRFLETYKPLDTWFEVSAHPVPDGLAVYFQDVTERRRTEIALRERMKELRCLYRVLEIVSDPQLEVEEIVNAVVSVIPAGLVHEVNTVVCIKLGDITARSEPWREPAVRLDIPVSSDNGAIGNIMVGYVQETDEPAEFLADEKQMIEVIARHLGAMQDRRSMHERLSQSERINAIGELTGGVAHDFNNLLTVIMGNTELLVEQLEGQPQLKSLADITVTAAKRGSELTNRLLAFARKQVLEPRAVDASRLISDMEPLLRRTLPTEIDIEVIRAGGLWLADVDPGQLEVALLNLAINARDAMHGGGRLTLETANTSLNDTYAAAHPEVDAGHYVMVSVSDTGCGMSPEVMARAFEPFFTTKGAGKGSGLGLSMVHGFAKQSGGHIKIYSEPGEGTTVKIYLPRAQDNAQPFVEETDDLKTLRGNEHVLVVEDDTLVREHVVKQLRSLGYRVSAAESAEPALGIIRQRDDIDLLFTDVIMPGMNGRHLSEAATRLRPALKVLYTSGYTENAIVHHGRLDRGVDLLSKPYRRQELAQKVRKVLDRQNVNKDKT